MPRLTLYNFWRSSSSQRVRIALALKGLDYEYVSVNLVDGEQSSDLHRARSPTGYVPCLAVDGVPYAESVAIIELLEERFPEVPLYPGDAHGRARLRTLVEIVNSVTQPLQNLRVLKYLGDLGQDTDAQERWLHHFVGRGLASFERAMEVNAREGVIGPYSHGEAPTAADAFLVPQVDAAKRYRLDLAGYPRVSAAYDAAMRLEAFQKAAPERQPDAPKK
jgi:maleylacetoacetate isomerase